MVAKDVPAPPDAKYIIELRGRLEDQFSERDALYAKIDTHDRGSHHERSLRGRWKSEDKTLMPDFVPKRDMPGDQIMVHILQPIVEQKRAMLGVVPQKHCPRRSPDDDTTYADRLERVYRGMWARSDEGAFMGDMAWLLARYGAAVAGVWPDSYDDFGMPSKITWPRFIIRSPRYFYPVRKDPFWRTLAECVFVTEYFPSEARTIWPEHADEMDGDTVEVIEYWNENYRVSVLSVGKTLDVLGHKLGYVPWTIIPNIGIPGSPFGDSDIALCFELQKVLNLRLSQESDYLRRMIDPPLHVNDKDEMPDPIPTGPGAVWTTRGPNGTAEYKSLPNTNYQWETALQRIFDMIDRMADAPSPLRSEFGGSVLTGKGFNSLLGPVTGRIKLREGYIYPKLVLLSKMGLKAHITWNGNKKCVVYGSERSGPFVETFRPTEFKDWMELVLEVDPTAYMDVSQQVILGLQQLSQNVLSRRSFMEKSPWIQDVAAEIKQIIKERREDVNLTVAAQMYAEGMMTNNANIGTPARENYMLERGAISEPSPPEIPGVETVTPGAAIENMQSEMMPGMGGEPDLLVHFVDTIRAAQVHGEVWLAGDLADDGTLNNSGMVELYLSDMNDKAAILNAVRNSSMPDVKALHGKIKFWPLADLDVNEPHINCTPGSSGYDVEGGIEGEVSEEEPQMGPPEDALGLIGAV